MTDLSQRLRSEAASLDQQDPLKHILNDFLLPEDCIYLDGNSLGPLPKAAKTRAKTVVEQQWGDDLISSWNKHQWIDLPAQVGAKIAPLLGAEASQVIACDSISVNLTKVLCAALHKCDKSLVLSQSDNFPTDLYMVQGLSDLLGKSKCELVCIDEDEILSSIDKYAEQAAVLMLTHVNFRSGRILDMAAITEAAHRHDILVIWDLAHSAGALELDLNGCNVDYAVGCTYKYLNGGPGAPAFVYAAKRHLNDIRQPLSGWMGHKKPFEFTQKYEAGQGVRAFLAGTPQIISMSVLDASLDIFNGLSAQQIREKSVSLLGFFEACFDALFLPNDGFICITPSEPCQRGSQLAYSHPDAYAICQALIDKKVIADFRAPNILRLGFSPLFLRHQDMLEAALRLKVVMENKLYLNSEYQVKHAVT
ncbi:kynureninase [Ningiella sp. W23]|uniref:kynureninase n=1 Tax=Ningiella sp. W23 TaxID=3023715 RepID=UPI00375775B7